MDTNVTFACPGVTNPLSKFVLFTSQTSTNQEKCGHKDTRPPLRALGVPLGPFGTSVSELPTTHL